MRLRILIRDGYECHWCGRHATTVDHLVPRALGGSDYDPRNLVASCARCNFKRGGQLAHRLGHTGREAKPRKVWAGAIGQDGGMPYPAA